MMADCSRPFYDILVSTVNNPGAIFDWVFCPYAAAGLGMTGVGVFILATGFVGLKNWTEGWVVPGVWLAIVAPTLAAAMLPGNVIRQIAGVLTLGFALLFVGLYYWWGRA